MRSLWRGLLLIAMGGLGWGAWYLAAHPNWGESAPQQAPAGLTVRAQSLTISGWQSHGGKAEKLWQVTARDVGGTADGQSQQFQQITEGILYQNDQPIARFTAGHGEGNQAGNTFNIHGGAHLQLEGDDTALSTEEVFWRGPERQLWLPRPVVLTRGELRLQGSRAHLDQQRGRLTAEFVSGSDGEFHFEAHHGLLFLKERRLELYPVAIRLPAGEGHALRVVYFAAEGRMLAQEIQMKLSLSPAAARTAAVTGLTLALFTAASGAPAPEKKVHHITVDGEKLADTKQEMVIQHAVVHDEDTTVTADQMVIEKDAAGKPERMIATGSPRAVNDRNEVTGEKMIVYPKERRAVVEEKVHVIVRPKPGEAPPDENADPRDQVKDGTMTCDRLEYDYRNKNIAAQGHLVMISRGRTVAGDRATYIDKTEEAQFFGPVHYRDEKLHRTFETAAGLTLKLKKGAEEVHAPGKFHASFTVEDEEESPAATTSPPGSPQKSAAAPKPPAAPESTTPGEKKAP